MSIYTSKKPRGFALLEVLIAVVVMAFGLLALAALQSSLARSAAQSKARTVALSLAKDQLESLRTYETISGYYAITDRTLGAIDLDPVTAGVQSDIAGVNYSVGWQATRYALAKSSGKFVAGLADTGALDAAAYEKNNEFKRIVVSVRWTDVTNTAQTVSLEDAISALDPTDSARLAKSGGAVGPRKPIVLIKDPGTEDGVIPIAVGDGAETAATNPKPVILSRAGDDTVETRFDVLTYAALKDGSGNAVAQSKVETSVIGCSCSAATTSTGYRPTYWDGKRYVPPQKATSTSNAVSTNGVTQSPYCTICCRDHRDPVGVAGPKFSPRRAAHDHYRLVSNVLQPAVAGQPYLEACRLIRVDGLFSVAADLSNDFFNLLETESNGDKPVPSTAGKANYQQFVLDYMGARFGKTSSTTNPTLTPYNNQTAPSPAVYASTNKLDVPDEIAFDATKGLKWLHSRGLYVDYLEPPAISAVTNAVTDCKSSGGGAPSTNEVRDCALRVLPFTSINLTEISEWSPTSGTQIKVSNDDFDTTIAVTTPVRGKVTPGSAPTQGKPVAKTSVSSSNSGVAIFGDIDPDDAASTKADTQIFNIGSAPSGPPGGSFGMLVTNSADSTLQTGYTYASRFDTCTGTYPRICTTRVGETLPADITVTFGHYNTQGTDQVITNACGGTQGVPNLPYKVVYDVTGVSVVDAQGNVRVEDATFDIGMLTAYNEGLVGAVPTGEYTQSLIKQINEGDQVQATLGAPTFMCPDNYPGSGKDFMCAGTGSSATPTWSQTFVACPSQTGIPDFP